MRADWFAWVVAAVFFVAIVFWVTRGECAWCASFPCFNSSVCGSGCVCLKVGGEMQGSCVSID